MEEIGSNDYRLFAVASACSICNGQDPSTLKNIMRLHVVNAISKQKLLPFPAKLVRTGKITIQFSEEVPVYCCVPDDGSKMVQRCMSTEWYHTKCAKIPEHVIDSPKQWRCSQC